MCEKEEGWWVEDDSLIKQGALIAEGFEKAFELGGGPGE